MVTEWECLRACLRYHSIQYTTLCQCPHRKYVASILSWQNSFVTYFLFKPKTFFECLVSTIILGDSFTFPFITNVHTLTQLCFITSYLCFTITKCMVQPKLRNPLLLKTFNFLPHVIPPSHNGHFFPTLCEYQ